MFLFWKLKFCLKDRHFQNLGHSEQHTIHMRTSKTVLQIRRSLSAVALLQKGSTLKGTVAFIVYILWENFTQQYSHYFVDWPCIFIFELFRNCFSVPTLINNKFVFSVSGKCQGSLSFLLKRHNLGMYYNFESFLQD